MNRLWTGVGVALALAAGGLTWALMGQSDSDDAATSDNAHLHAGLKADALLQSGLLQVQYQDYADAKATFHQVLAVDPGSKLAWYNLGVIAQKENREGDARKAYDAALKSDPRFTSALFNKALMLEKGEPDEALRLLRRAVAVNPKASTAYFHIGRTLAAQGHDKQAGDAYRHAVEIDPGLRPQVPEPFADSLPASHSPAPHDHAHDSDRDSGRTTENSGR
ncbi:tetratricopeptide repeat protein [Streptomyces sp. NPDC048664]|uniref:tetratricopeptide repeat protein n=1 Tax=Streptomyces sp. NPDC048664 TaxID=3154505 RepID=UPI003447854B